MPQDKLLALLQYLCRVDTSCLPEICMCAIYITVMMQFLYIMLILAVFITQRAEEQKTKIC